MNFLREPRHAADRSGDAGGAPAVDSAALRRRIRPHGYRHDATLIVHYLKNGGPLLVVKKVGNRLRRRLGR